MTQRVSARPHKFAMASSDPAAPRRFLALWFPFLPSDRLWLAQGHGLSPEAPLAFVEKQKGAMRLVSLNRAAVEAGLAPGLGLADARAIVPELAIHHHDPVADAELLDRLADRCTRYTPMVAVEPPDGIMLDITGSTHLAGGEGPLVQAVQGHFADWRITVRLAPGSSAEAAHALARFGHGEAGGEQATIRALPVAALALDPESELALRRAGLKTVGDVLDRPRKVIAARFGPASVYRLERLVGVSAKPIVPRSPAPRRRFRRRFAEPIASHDYAIGIVRELLAEANLRLVEEDLGGRAFEARFFRVDGLVRHLRVETGLPTRDEAAIARLFDERLDSLADPLDPGFGFDSVELEVLQVQSLKPSQEDIEGEARSDSPLAGMLDILATRLGRNRLLRFGPNDSYIPENGQIPSVALDTPEACIWPRPQVGEPPVRPLHLFDPPQRITVISEVPDGAPRRFRWRRKLHDVVRQEGPERIAAEWWKGSDDPLGRDRLTRDYYRIEDSDGRRYWVFRHGLHAREVASPEWYLHGLFA